MLANPKDSPPADRALCASAASGDASSQRLLIDRLLCRTRTTVFYLAAGDRDADDLVQESLVEILLSAGSFRGESSLERWADRIVVRTALRHLRRRRGREKVVTLESDPPPGATEQEGALQRRQLRRRLAHLLDRLKPERRTVVVLHWVRGYTVKEIAELTSTGPHTVRDRLMVGKRKLKKWILKDPVLKDWARAIDENAC